MHKGNICGHVVLLALMLGCVGLTNSAIAQQKWSPCKPVEAATYATRIHVKCESAVDRKFWYFAVSTADSKFAARALSVIEAGQLGDKFVRVLFDPSDQSGPAFGCAISDCRPMAAAILTESRPAKCDTDDTQRGCSGFCAANGNNDLRCPGYCAAHPNVHGCPGSCTTHDTPTCPGYCARHPSEAICDPRCLNPSTPGCPGPPR
jgi:hypothetical protein